MKELIDGRTIHLYIDPLLKGISEGDRVEIVRSPIDIEKYVLTGIKGEITNMEWVQNCWPYHQPTIKTDDGEIRSPKMDELIIIRQDLNKEVEWSGKPRISITIEETIEGVFKGKTDETDDTAILATSLDWMFEYIKTNHKDIPTKQITPNITVPVFERTYQNNIRLGSNINGRDNPMFFEEDEDEQPRHTIRRGDTSDFDKEMWLWIP